VDDQTGNNQIDKNLVGNVLTGDTKAFGTIIKNTEGLVALIVFKMIINAEDRKDLAQDIYLKAFHNLSGFKFQAKLSTWIGQIAYNTCLHYLEKKKLVLIDPPNHENDSDDQLSNLLNHGSIGLSNNETEKLIWRKELSVILQTETDKLLPVYKTILTLFHQQELSYGEITQITGLPEGTVKSYLFRARKTLKEAILSKYKKEDL
jgi:RNA polymerase sigma factor (sigma-70 family)